MPERGSDVCRRGIDEISGGFAGLYWNCKPTFRSLSRLQRVRDDTIKQTARLRLAALLPPHPLLQLRHVRDVMLAMPCIKGQVLFE